ncbi:MAG: hypothetical protein RL748_141 [Pseudomonadota bacterium]|jgi:uncharacterized protein YndB with AHSA1/START domain
MRSTWHNPEIAAKPGKIRANPTRPLTMRLSEPTPHPPFHPIAHPIGYLLFWLALLLLGCQSLAHAASDPNFQVKVKRHAGKVMIDVNMLIAVPPHMAFEVMTDYNHMSSFLPSVTTSKITQKDGNRLTVEQKGRASSGPISFAFETVREINLIVPSEIQSKIIGGSIKQGESLTKFSAEHNGTRMVIHSESSAPAIMPPIVGVAFVEGQTRKQYGLLRDEMLKRQRALEHKAHPSAAAASAHAAAQAGAAPTSSAHAPPVPGATATPGSTAGAPGVSSPKPKQ